MLSGNKKKPDENLIKLRELAAICDNRLCFDCHQKGPTYVNMTIGAFICTKCSGLLRGLNPPHRVKSISMATFSAKEIEFLEQRGNGYCHNIWLGLFDPKSYSDLFANITARGGVQQDQDRFKEYMIDKYEKRMWHVTPEELQLQLEREKELLESNGRHRAGSNLSKNSAEKEDSTTSSLSLSSSFVVVPPFHQSNSGSNNGTGSSSTSDSPVMITTATSIIHQPSSAMGSLRNRKQPLNGAALKLLDKTSSTATNKTLNGFTENFVNNLPSSSSPASSGRLLHRTTSTNIKSDALFESENYCIIDAPLGTSFSNTCSTQSKTAEPKEDALGKVKSPEQEVIDIVLRGRRSESDSTNANDNLDAVVKNIVKTQESRLRPIYSECSSGGSTTNGFTHLGGSNNNNHMVDQSPTVINQMAGLTARVKKDSDVSLASSPVGGLDSIDGSASNSPKLQSFKERPTRRPHKSQNETFGTGLFAIKPPTQHATKRKISSNTLQNSASISLPSNANLLSNTNNNLFGDSFANAVNSSGFQTQSHVNFDPFETTDINTGGRIIEPSLSSSYIDTHPLVPQGSSFAKTPEDPFAPASQILSSSSLSNKNNNARHAPEQDKYSALAELDIVYNSNSKVINGSNSNNDSNNNTTWAVDPRTGLQTLIGLTKSHSSNSGNFASLNPLFPSNSTATLLSSQSFAAAFPSSIPPLQMSPIITTVENLKNPFLTPQPPVQAPALVHSGHSSAPLNYGPVPLQGISSSNFVPVHLTNGHHHFQTSTNNNSTFFPSTKEPLLSFDLPQRFSQNLGLNGTPLSSSFMLSNHFKNNTPSIGAYPTVTASTSTSKQPYLYNHHQQLYFSTNPFL